MAPGMGRGGAGACAMGAGWLRRGAKGEPMPAFQSDGLTLSYERFGAGPPVLCIHGFASSGKVNWIDTGWVEALVAGGYSAVVLDNRGHGASDKPYDPELYYPRDMARDAVA